MSHQDQSLKEKLNSDLLEEALQWFLKGICWKSITLRRDCTWTAKLLARAALLWSWSDESTLQERFSISRRLVAHLAPKQVPLAVSSQAFMKLLRRWSTALIGLLVLAARQRVRKVLSEHWKCCGLPVFGADGSQIELPRTKSHEAAFSPCCKRSGKKKQNRRKKPQSAAANKKAKVPLMRMMTLFHVGTGLPWDWRLGPSDSSEREQALDIIKTVPEKGLLVTDAGFSGYDFAQQVLQNGWHLLMRVGANVKLLKKLGYVQESEGIVYLWPDKAAKARMPPLVFRLIIAEGLKAPIYLITSILDREVLSDEDVFELYLRRWRVELLYRDLKQTSRKRKLKSRTAENAEVEMHWAMMALWVLGLSVAAEIVKNEISLSRISMAKALLAMRRLMRDYLHHVEPDKLLQDLLGEAVVDTYKRKNKSSRDYPRKKKGKRPGPPTIAEATQQQIQQASALSAIQRANDVASNPPGCNEASILHNVL